MPCNCRLLCPSLPDDRNLGLDVERSFLTTESVGALNVIRNMKARHSIRPNAMQLSVTLPSLPDDHNLCSDGESSFFAAVPVGALNVINKDPLLLKCVRLSLVL